MGDSAVMMSSGTFQNIMRESFGEKDGSVEIKQGERYFKKMKVIINNDLSYSDMRILDADVAEAVKKLEEDHNLDRGAVDFLLSSPNVEIIQNVQAITQRMDLDRVRKMARHRGYDPDAAELAAKDLAERAPSGTFWEHCLAIMDQMRAGHPLLQRMIEPIEAPILLVEHEQIDQAAKTMASAGLPASSFIRSAGAIGSAAPSASEIPEIMEHMAEVIKENKKQGS